MSPFCSLVELLLNLSLILHVGCETLIGVWLLSSPSSFLFIHLSWMSRNQESHMVNLAKKPSFSNTPHVGETFDTFVEKEQNPSRYMQKEFETLYTFYPISMLRYSKSLLFAYNQVQALLQHLLGALYF
jgi:hypothetical protein